MTVSPYGEPQVDPARWDDLVDNLEEAIIEIVNAYLEDTPVRIAEMRLALEQEDYETVQLLAHSLKSSSGIFGAQRMIALCLDLEHTARSCQTGCEEKIDAIQAVFEKLAAELNSRLEAYHP